MTRLIIYFVALLLFFAIVFKVLRALNLENAFKKNHVWEIKVAYIIFSIVIAHLLAEVVMKLYGWSVIIIQNIN
ncbi:DUF1146 domain-containing protein [Haploplasma axanthum]|uniref:Protein of uncharacterized function (DUF1146) n=1 Tax=Haploplasma axanthum TaxID=29552 RepID=A0A449BCV6_HAPAX|nr:DUF1146 domain-containing protein [Haploplasma axanthum]VEU80247.1 Protein of uncharacterised function (DUF1146) [Haploplasma axanthum]